MEKSSLVVTELEPPIAVVRLNRPEALNALSPQILRSLCHALDGLDGNPEIRAIILTGSERAFAAGADIRTLAKAEPQDILRWNTAQHWQRIRKVNKPLIAAVSGYAYGGGCELALACDLIVAAETACFAQPEIKLGIMPGAGGTQRLSKAIGPYLTMEMVLTGEPLSAHQAYACGLVNRLVPSERLLDEARELAQLIAARPPIAVRLARQAVRHGIDHSLAEGMEVERRNYVFLYGTHDQKEGMQAFLEKRPPNFTGT